MRNDSKILKLTRSGATAKILKLKIFFMSSFDVSNLFAINICLDSLYTSGNGAIIGLPRNLFIQFLELSVKNYFMCVCVQFKTVQTNDKNTKFAY